MSIITGPTVLPKTDIQALQVIIEELRSRIAALEANREAAVPRLYQLTDTTPLSQAANGDAPRYDQASGLWLPAP